MLSRPGCHFIRAMRCAHALLASADRADAMTRGQVLKKEGVCDPTAVKGKTSAASSALDGLTPLIGAGLVRLHAQPVCAGGMCKSRFPDDELSPDLAQEGPAARASIMRTKRSEVHCGDKLDTSVSY